MPIETPRALQEHLQSAIEVELSTIPPYLYAMYSIEDEESEAYRSIRSVVVEEMLHLVLAANVLTAIGGRPRFYDEDVVPSYPTPLPHRQPDLTLTLERCTPEVVGRVFTIIERPRATEGLPEDTEYLTVGQFYRAIEDAIDRLDDEYPIFESARVDHQMGESGYYRPVEFDVEESGGLHPVEDAASARRALDTVIHQGEGFEGDERYADLDHEEMSHYHKFRRIADGTVPVGETRPLLTNPARADLPSSLGPVAELFDACYCYVLLLLEHVFSPIGTPTKGRIVRDLYRLMRKVLQPVARFLTRQPVGDDGTKRAGPTFQFYRFDWATDPADHLLERCDDVVDDHPELERVRPAVAKLGVTD